MPSVAVIAIHWNQKVHKYYMQTFDCLTKHEKASLEILGQKLLAPPLWALPQPQKSHTMDTKENDKQNRCAIFQKRLDSIKRPINYQCSFLNYIRCAEIHHPSRISGLRLKSADALENVLGCRSVFWTDHVAQRWTTNQDKFDWKSNALMTASV